MLYSIVAVLVIILDQAVKNWVSNTLFGTDVVKFIPGVVSLVNVHNDGAAFGFLGGGNARIYFIVITGIFTVAVILALVTNFISGPISRWSIVLVMAGGLANCIDRVIYGYVQDMFKVELFDFAIFNVADIFITVFAIVFALAMIFERQEDDEEDEYLEEDDQPKKEQKKHKSNPLLSRFKKGGSIDEDDEEAPSRSSRKTSKRAKYEDEYEQYKAQRSATKAEKPRPQAKKDTVHDSSDPFAEWERANAKVDSQRSSTYAAKAMGTSAPVYTKPLQPQPQQPDYIRPDAASVSQSPPVAPPPAPVQPAPVPETKPASKSSSDFDLDDILSEFK